MSFVSSKWIRRFSVCVVAIVVAVPSGLLAQTSHVVSPADLQRQAAAVTQTRQQNIEKVCSFLSSPTAEQTMQKAHINSGQVKAAVPNLSDDELAQLAARADKAQHDFAAGLLSTRDIALIILGVVVIILIIVIAS
jgi:hypothetical protein